MQWMSLVVAAGDLLAFVASVIELRSVMIKRRSGQSARRRGDSDPKGREGSSL